MLNEVPRSVKQSLHKGAENINKPHRKEQPHKMVRKKFSQEPKNISQRSRAAHIRLPAEAPCGHEREPTNVPQPQSPGRHPDMVGPFQSCWESCHSRPCYKCQRSSVTIYLCLGRIQAQDYLIYLVGGSFLSSCKDHFYPENVLSLE